MATAPNLGTAEQFAILGHSGVTGSTGAGTAVYGDVGTSPTATITNFPPSTVVAPFTKHTTNDAIVQQAHTDAIAAYVDLTNQVIAGPTTVIADNLSTVGILTPGIYEFGAGDLPVGQTLILNDPTGTGIFIFQADSSLTMNVGSSISGTANPCNIYWRIGTSATLDGVNFWGTVVADASITVSSTDNITGRLLAGTGPTGAVTIAGSGGNTIRVDSCTTAPSLTSTKSFSPSTIRPGGTSTLTVTITNSNNYEVTGVAFTDTYPSGITNTSTSPSTTSGGVVTATPGGNQLTLTGGTIPANSSVTVTAYVTNSTTGSYSNTITAINSSQIASSVGSSGTLIVRRRRNRLWSGGSNFNPCPTCPPTSPNYIRKLFN